MSGFNQELNGAIAINGGLSTPDPWNFGSLVQQVAASGTVTLTGTETNSDILTIDFSSQQLVGGSHAVSITASGGASLTTLATNMAAAINADPYLSELGVIATSALAVITIKWRPGPLGNFCAYQFISGGATPIVTLTGSPTTGDYINVLITNQALPGNSRNVQYKVTSSDTTLTLLATHVAAAVSADPVLTAAGIAATSAAGVVTITFPAAGGAVMVGSNTNGVKTATLGGSLTVGDPITITVTDSGLTGGSLPIVYTVKSSDTTLTILGNSIAAALNASVPLNVLGVSATASAGVISISSSSPNATTYSKAVGGAATETVTLAGGPGETATAGGNATETATVVQPSGGAGYITPLQDYRLPVNGSFVKLYCNKPLQVDYLMLKNLIAAGISLI